MLKKLIITLTLGLALTNYIKPMEKEFKEENQNLVAQFFKKSDLFSNPESIFYLPKEIKDIIGRKVIKSSAVLAWLLKQMKIPQIIINPDLERPLVIFNNQGNLVLVGTGIIHWEKINVKIYDAKTGQFLETVTNPNHSILATFKETDEAKRLPKIDRKKYYIFSNLHTNGNVRNVVEKPNKRRSKYITIASTLKIWDIESELLLITIKNVAYDWMQDMVEDNKQCDKIAICNNDSIHIWDISIINFLENELTLEQVLFLYYIYETIELQRRKNKLRDIDREIYLDLNQHKNLIEIYNSFTDQVKEVLAKFVKD